MRFLSLFSGIEAASAAWAPLGWECVAVAEIDPFASAALAILHPRVRNLGDITKLTQWDIADLGHIDLVVFGSPCQDLSVAGKQKGLSGERSGLFFPAVDIISWARLWCGTRFALWENVPGAFASNKGRDFAAVVDALAGLDGTQPPPKGWGTEGCAVGPEAMVEWSTLDAQWFGVAQRRRRVFALADFGDWAGRQPILLEPKSMRGDSAPSREAGEDAAAGTLRSTDGGCDVDHARAGHLQPVAFGGNNTSGPIDVATARNACSSSSGRLDFESETFLVQCVTGDITQVAPVLAFDTTQVTSVASRSNPKIGDPCHPLAAGAHPPAMAFQSSQSGVRLLNTHATLDAHNGPRRHNGALIFGNTWQVRRLTPIECERLQGFQDNHTRIPFRKKTAAQCPDGPRYKVLGNSMAVPVMRWIGQRIDAAVFFQEDSTC